MKDGLKKSVQSYIGSKQLSPEQLEDLDKLVNTNLNVSRQKSSSKSLFKVNAFVALLVVAIVFSIFWGLRVNDKGDVAVLIAEEVAYNHLKMKPMEISSSSLNDLRQYFSKLDFSLSHSQFVTDNHLKLIGGRYCSIQGESAAQLHMQNELTGDIQIVYQAPYNKELFQDLPKLYDGQPPVRHYVNGIAVDIWVDKGILFARSLNIAENTTQDNSQNINNNQ